MNEYLHFLPIASYTNGVSFPIRFTYCSKSHTLCRGLGK